MLAVGSVGPKGVLLAVTRGAAAVFAAAEGWAEGWARPRVGGCGVVEGVRLNQRRRPLGRSCIPRSHPVRALEAVGLAVTAGCSGCLLAPPREWVSRRSGGKHMLGRSWWGVLSRGFPFEDGCLHRRWSKKCERRRWKRVVWIRGKTKCWTWMTKTRRYRMMQRIGMRMRRKCCYRATSVNC